MTLPSLPAQSSTDWYAHYTALHNLATNPDDTGFDLILLMGQSNMVGQNTDVDEILDPLDPRVFTFNYGGTYGDTIAQAYDPLYHQSGSNGVGPGLPFARWYASSVPGNRRVLLVPAAYASSALAPTSGISWKANNAPTGDNLYLNARLQAQAALTAAGANARIVAALWIQGETDYNNGVSGAAYEILMDELVGQLRADLSIPTLPFVIGGMVPEGGRTTIDAVHADTPDRVRYTGYAAGPTGHTEDDLHYTAAGQRILGRSMFEAYRTAVTNTSPPVAPVPTPYGGGGGSGTPPTRADYSDVGQVFAGVQQLSTTTIVGDVLVAHGFANIPGTTLAPPTGGTGLTWTEVSTGDNAGYSRAYVWTAVATTAETATLSFTGAGSGKLWAALERWTGSAGVGATSQGRQDNVAPSLNITTTADNSAISVGLVDWNTVDGASRAWRTGAGAATELAYVVGTAGAMNVYVAAHADADAAGVKAVGLTAPTGMKPSMVAVEILPSA